jgi:pimeloyl-ACP methyl ester carboxylesterase
MQYEYSAREHAIALGALRDACKRFSIDTDRVYLSGHSMGGDAAWDIALAHPDLWAGVIPITATMGKYVERYWQNAAKLPMYFVSGELDGGKTVTNAPQFDKYYMQPGWDMTLVEYQGRGHEHFSDEILRIFDWMGRKKRDFFPKEFHAVTMRTWDNFFWCVELSDMPAGQMVDPATWPPPRNTLPMNLTVRQVAAPANGVNVEMHSAKLTVWLSPEYVNFTLPIEVKINGTRVATAKGMIKPSIPLMLEDVRTRGDRQHPFWAKVEQ